MTKNSWLTTILSLGWVFLFLFLSSAYYFNKFSAPANHSMFATIVWEDHLSVFEGVLKCNLTSAELQERKAILKEEIFSKVLKKTEVEGGYIYYLKSDEEMLDKVLEFIAKEKQCCPFFKFDLSVLPFNKGMALQISGSKEVKQFLDGFENDED